MARLILASALVAISAACSAAYPSCGSHPFFSMRKDDGTTIGLVASEEDVAKGPAWTPGHSEPPLSPGKAIQLATAWAQSNWKRFDSFRVHTITLQGFGCDTQHEKWLYVVDMAPVVDGNAMFGGAYFVGVLMDGSILPAKPVKDF